MHKGIVYWILLLQLAFTISALAKDLGVIGEVYPIAEQDFLEFIQARLKKFEQTGELIKLQQDMQTQAQKHVDRPPPVVNISLTKSARSWIFDPSIRIKEDLKDRDGKIFAKAGTVVNPLKTISLTSTLLFYDADDELQVKWAQKVDREIAAANKRTKLILVNGSILNQIKIFHKPIYFDQKGRLTTRFGIQHVPAIVKQEGLFLRIDEVVP